MEIVNDVYA